MSIGNCANSAINKSADFARHGVKVDYYDCHKQQ